MVEEEQDGSVPGCGGEGRADGGDDMDPSVVAVTAWRRRRRRGSGKFWQTNSVQVKILWLGFKDRVAGGFIVTGMIMSSSSSLLCFCYFNELVKLYKCYQMKKHYILSLKLI
jgi:hypothetical protein